MCARLPGKIHLVNIERKFQVLNCQYCPTFDINELFSTTGLK